MGLPEGHARHLQKQLDGHRNRIRQLQADIDVRMRELQVHRTILEFGTSEGLADAISEIWEAVQRDGVEGLDIVRHLASHGLSLPEGFTHSVAWDKDKGTLTLCALSTDDLFPSEILWNSADGYGGRTTNMVRNPRRGE